MSSTLADQRASLADEVATSHSGHAASEETVHDTEPASTNPEKAAAGDLEKSAGNADLPNSKEAANGPAGPPPGAPTFPDGGLWAWLTVLGGFLVLFTTFGMLNAYGIFEQYYLAVYLPNTTPSQIAWVGSFQLFLQFGCGLLVGKLFDEGFFHYIIAFGSALWIVSWFCISISTKYWSIFLSQGLGLGLANGILFLPSVGVIAHHFKRRKAIATGIVVAGSSTGGVCFPIMLNKLFYSNVGFTKGVQAAGYIGVGCLIIANLTMRTRLPPRKKRPAHLQKPPNMKAILTDIPYLIAIAGGFSCILGIFFVFFYLQVFASSHGLSENVSFYSLAILNAASVFGRTIPNLLADSYGPFNLMIPCCFCAGVLIWVMLACTNPGGIIAMAILYGFFSGAYVSLLPGVLTGFAKGVPEIGVRLGLAFLVSGFGALLGTPIDGWLLGAEFTWWKPATFSGTMVMVGTALFILARHMAAKERGTQIL